MDELDALWAFLVAAVVAFAVTPPVARLATRMGVVHQPRERDLHERPVPGLGGLAILAAVLVAAVFFMPAGQETRGIIGGAIAITLVGAIDDIRPGGLNPALKLAGQFAAAAIPVFAEVRVENMTLPFIEPIDLGNWGYPLTLLGIVAVMNVVNFTDGADGLAAGVCTIAAATFAVIALSSRPRGRRPSSPRSPPAPRSASSGTTSTRPRSSWATPARTCSGCCSPASRSRAC